MKKIVILIMSLALAAGVMSSCAKKGGDSQSSSEPSSLSQSSTIAGDNSEMTDPEIDPDLVGRDLKDGDEITYAPEKEAIMNALNLAADDIWKAGKFADLSDFKNGNESAVPPKGLDKIKIDKIDDIKVIYQDTKDGEFYTAYYQFDYKGSKWTLVADYRLVKGSFDKMADIYFVNEAR
jgi:hypothetical protein